MEELKERLRKAGKEDEARIKAEEENQESSKKCLRGPEEEAEALHQQKHLRVASY